MTVRSLPSAAVPADAAFVSVLALAGVSPRDRVHVIGPGAYPAMLWLCRQGYEQAVHLDAASPCGHIEPAAAVLVPHLIQGVDLTFLLSGGGRLREGGVLVLRAGVRLRPADAVASVLTANGYRLALHLAHRGHAFHIAHRLAPGPAQTAA